MCSAVLTAAYNKWVGPRYRPTHTRIHDINQKTRAQTMNHSADCARTRLHRYRQCTVQHLIIRVLVYNEQQSTDTRSFTFIIANQHTKQQ